MQIGILGMGRMGKGLAARLLKDDHEVVVWNRTPEAAEEVAKDGATAAQSVEEVIEKLDKPRVIWVMLPSVNKEDPDAPTVTDETIDKLTKLLDKDDILIDGGNSRWTKSQEHDRLCRAKGIRFLDIGTSGGVLGPRIGYAMMAGGDESAWDHIQPLVKSMTPEGGGGYFGPAGAGHYVKMIHNSIEYGMMQAFGEGMNLLANGHYPDVDLAKVAHVWDAGSIVRSLLSELLAEALDEDGRLKKIGDEVDENGEGRWSAEAALEKRIPYTVNGHAVFQRWNTTGRDEFANKTLAILRNKFGGHAVEEKKPAKKK
ncbi:MAG: decarboxylating 6-phosphogluconate dehydrogenase [Patescibacteria group bacterium]|nr:decarboxylating 6-phosphogluconate dehydrogenase [Patescibacteria group bacterium]